MKIDDQTLRQLWPRGDSKVAGLIAGIAASSEEVFAAHRITTPLQVAHIMAQISLECGAGTEVIENLSYSARRMTQVWPGRFPTVLSAAPYAANPRKLANKVYNGRMGNAVGSDDGWNFRGRGATQTTGRDAYTRLGAAAGVDLIGNPDLLIDPDRFLEFGVADFIMCGCLPFCAPKPGLPLGDIRAVTHHINGGYTGLADRQAWFKRWCAVLKPSASFQPVALLAAPVSSAQPESDVADDGVLRYGRGHDAPDFEVKALQDLLVSKGYQVGANDGDFGGGLRAAVLAAQADNGLPTTGEVDAATKAAFRTMPDKPISEDRANATAADLRDAGSETVKDGQQIGLVGKGMLVLGGGKAADASGALDSVKDTIDQVSTLRSVADNASDLLQWAAGHWWIGAAAAGFAIWWLGGKVIARRLTDHRTAANTRF